MESIRVLIVDDNMLLCRRISEQLTAKNGLAQIECVGDGAQALSMLKKGKYDILLMDLILPQIDGFGLLEGLRQNDITPPANIVVISALSQDDVIRRACNLGANYFVVKPFDIETLCRRLLDTPVPKLENSAGPFARMNSRTGSVKSLDERISNVFLAVGIPAHIKGYHFLREAVKLVYADRTIINAITKELYPGVAKAMDTSASKVERAIRHAIEVSWARGKIENINAIFGYTIYSKHEKPTNGEFIALVADKLITDDLTRNEQAS